VDRLLASIEMATPGDPIRWLPMEGKRAGRDASRASA
jgi:hypothetical protein